MKILTFNASTDHLPLAPKDSRLNEIRFKTCPGSPLRLFVVKTNTSSPIDDHGVYRDAWYKVECRGLPDRFLRLYDGSSSLRELLKRYGFQDGSGCVNHRDVEAVFVPKDDPLSRQLLVPINTQHRLGVPQFYKNSGICWFAAMCWTSFANDAIASIIRSKIPPEMRDLCKECLSDRNKAQQLRNMLWNKYGIGDDISQPPEMDGRNGFSEFTTFCAKFGIPMIRYKENSGTMKAMEPVVKDRKGNPCTVSLPQNKDEPHLLVLRYQDGDHTKFPVHRRIQFHKQRYKLSGMYMGSRKCGHQIGASTIDDNWRHWGIGDADLHKSGIGPFYIIFSGSEWNTDNWWKAWKHVVHVTKFGANTSEFCNINPQNPSDSSLDKYRGTVGSTSIDVLYVPDIH